VLKRFFAIFLVGFIGFGCQTDPVIPAVNESTHVLVIPSGFPEMEFPENNAFSMDRWKLGKKLFFENMLSRDSSTSCGSCHQPGLAFSDDIKTSPGVQNRPGVRNAPTLANVGYHPYYTREGGVPTLEMQVLVPIQEHNEFDFNIVDISERLKNDSSYQQMSQKAYGRDLNYFSLVRAIATFERTLISGNSPFDVYQQTGNASALSGSEKEGMDLFFSTRTNCSNCHGGFDFTNYAFENNGLYESYADPGRMRLTGNSEDSARFKIPTLRNIAITAPYMHDGSMATLTEVIEHYKEPFLK